MAGNQPVDPQQNSYVANEAADAFLIEKGKCCSSINLGVYLPMRRTVIFLLLSIASTSGAGADEWYGPEYARCRDQSTAGIVQCVDALTKTWDGRLNRAYQTLMVQQDPKQKQALRDAQRLWIKYRDANCGFYAGGPGTISQVKAAECLRVMTKQRTIELEQEFGDR